MGLSHFKALEEKRQKDEKDKLAKDTAKPILERGVQSAPDFSKTSITPGIPRTPTVPNQSTPQGQRFAPPTVVKTNTVKAPTPAGQTSLKSSPAIRPQPSLRTSLTQGKPATFVKEALQGTARGYAAASAQVLSPDKKVTPYGPVDRAVFGTDKPFGFAEQQPFVKPDSKLAVPLAAAFVASDAIPGFGGAKKAIASKADDIAKAAKQSPVLFEQISLFLKSIDDTKPLASQMAAVDNFKPLLTKLNLADDKIDDAVEVFNRVMQKDTGAAIAKAAPTNIPKSSEAGFIKNPFASLSKRLQGTAEQSDQLLPPSPASQPLSDLSPQQSLSLSNDIRELKRAPEVNLSKLDISSKGKELIRQTAEEIKPKLSEIIGSPLTNKEVIDHAQFTSQTFKKAVSREQTKDWTVALTATRQKLAAMAETGVVDREFIETLQTVRSVASDAGRKLQSFAIEAKPAEITLKQYMIENMLDLGAKAEDLIKAAEGVNFDNINEAAKFYRKFIKPSARELADVLRYNSMLSSPLTHIVNIASNLINTTVVAPIEKAVAGGVDFLSATATGKAQKHFAGESGVYLKAYAGAIKEASDKFIEVMRGTSPVSNLDLRNIPLYPEGGVKGAAEKTLSVPMKLLEGMDQFFMTLGNAAETASLKYKEANTAEIAQQASKSAAYRVFRQELFPDGQGTLLNAVDTLTQQLFQLRNSKNPIVGWTARLTVPFVQTPMNIFKQGLEYSPAGYFTMIGAADKSAQLSKALMGSAVAATTALYAANGRLSWAEPTVETERNAFRDAGKQPYSIKIGDNWVSYQKLPPTLAFPISMIALTHDAMKQQKLDESTGEMILRSFAKYAQFMSDQSYAKSFGDLLGALSGSESDMARLASNYPQQFVPFRALTGWLARLTDDVQRKPDPDGTFIEKQVQLLMMNYPGLSKNVPARMNEEGEEIKAPNNVLNSVSPFRISTEDTKKSADFQGIMDIKQLEQEASAKHRIIKDQAEAEAAHLSTLSKGDQRRALRTIKKNNPALHEEIQNILDGEEIEYTGYEKKLKDATVETRAQMIVKDLKKMDKSTARKLKNDYKKRKIITDAVEDRMREIERENR